MYLCYHGCSHKLVDLYSALLMPPLLNTVTASACCSKSYYTKKIASLSFYGVSVLSGVTATLKYSISNYVNKDKLFITCRYIFLSFMILIRYTRRSFSFNVNSICPLTFALDLYLEHCTCRTQHSWRRLYSNYISCHTNIT